MILFLLSCTINKTIYLDTSESECASLTYNNFGSAFISRYCLGCHASNSNNREGAPSNITLETIENIEEYHSIILQEIEEEEMPPQGGVDEDIRQAAVDWLNCIGEVE